MAFLDNNNFSFGFLNKLIHLPILLSGNIKSRNDKIKIEAIKKNAIKRAKDFSKDVFNQSIDDVLKSL